MVTPGQPNSWVHKQLEIPGSASQLTFRARAPAFSAYSEVKGRYGTSSDLGSILTIHKPLYMSLT